MPTMKLADLHRETDKEYGDLKIALDDAEPDEYGEPTGDHVALMKGLRLGKERREKVKELTEKLDEVRADSPEVAKQRTKLNVAQNRLDTAGEKTGEQALHRLEERVAEEQTKLAKLIEKDEEDLDENEMIAKMGEIIREIIRTVARDRASADRLITACSTPENPDGDMYYLMGIFQNYRRGTDLGEASPSQT